MRWSVMVVPLLLSDLAVGASFRAATFSAPCSLIHEQEIALGSQPLHSEHESAATFAFRTELLGEQVTVSYLCKDGLLLTENYFFPKRSSKAALQDFRRVYDEFSSRYGDAFLDNTPWQPNPDPRVLEKDPLKYDVTWRKEELRVTIVLMPRTSDPAVQRQVFIVIAGIKTMSAGMPNKRFEFAPVGRRTRKSDALLLAAQAVR